MKINIKPASMISYPELCILIGAMNPDKLLRQQLDAVIEFARMQAQDCTEWDHAFSSAFLSRIIDSRSLCEWALENHIYF